MQKYDFIWFGLASFLCGGDVCFGWELVGG